MVKKRCVICRKTFTAHPKVGERQRTCSPECSRERHRQQCGKWNRKNRGLVKANQLAKHVEKARSLWTDSGKPAEGQKWLPFGIPRNEIKDYLGPEAVGIIEFILEILAKDILRQVKEARAYKSGG